MKSSNSKPFSLQYYNKELQVYENVRINLYFFMIP